MSYRAERQTHRQTDAAKRFTTMTVVDASRPNDDNDEDVMLFELILRCVALKNLNDCVRSCP